MEQAEQGSANDHRVAGQELALDIGQSSWLIHELQDSR